jgi:SH3 domain protein
MLICSVAASWAATRYVSDQLVVSLRKGPQANTELITYLKSNAPLEILEEDGRHFKVKTKAGEVGYIKAQYLTDELPKPVIISRLQKEKTRLGAKIKALEEQLDLASAKGDTAHQKIVAELKTKRELNSQLQKDLSKAQAELKSTSRSYQELKKNAENVVAITRERDDLHAGNAELAAKVDGLKEERDALMKSGAIKWFFTGAGVLFIGWFIGKMSGSRRRSSLL